MFAVAIALEQDLEASASIKRIWRTLATAGIDGGSLEPQMIFMTWNIQWGRGIDGRCDLARTIDEARAIADFDVLCLQEVAHNFCDLPGSNGDDQFVSVAQLLPGYRVIDGVAAETYDATGKRQRFGNVIASRIPVDSVFRHALPWEADSTQNMPRMLLEVVLRAPGGPLRVMTTHLEWSSDLIRHAQIEDVREIHRRACERHRTPRQPGIGPFTPQLAPSAAILLGDFNMTDADPSFGRLLEPFADGIPPLVEAWRNLHPNTTRPISFFLFEPDRQTPRCVDFVFLTPDLAGRLRSIAYDQETKASDHQPVVIELV
jgi:endonuclease/exonuclease/phosphatase family metal-dependent hydrolase